MGRSSWGRPFSLAALTQRQLSISNKAQTAKKEPRSIQPRLCFISGPEARDQARNRKSDETAAEAMARAEALRPVFEEFAKLSANACAAELNARGIRA